MLPASQGPRMRSNTAGSEQQEVAAHVLPQRKCIPHLCSKGNCSKWAFIYFSFNSKSYARWRPAPRQPAAFIRCGGAGCCLDYTDLNMIIAFCGCRCRTRCQWHCRGRLCAPLMPSWPSYLMVVVIFFVTVSMCVCVSLSLEMLMLRYCWHIIYIIKCISILNCFLILTV